MSVDKPSVRYALLVGVAVVIVAGTSSLIEKNLPGVEKRYSGNAGPSVASFSPSEDLETADIALLNGAHTSIDIAMYAFTDEKIASALTKAAQRGVKIRIYRDAVQFGAEEARAAQKAQLSITDRLSKSPGVEVRIKGGGQSMHLKAYCIDAVLLRTGSANWSPQGEVAQDNDLYVIRDNAIIEKFERDFDSIWSRSSNSHN